MTIYPEPYGGQSPPGSGEAVRAPKPQDVEKKLQAAKARNAKLQERLTALKRKKTAREMEKDQKTIINLRNKIDNI